MVNKPHIRQTRPGWYECRSARVVGEGLSQRAAWLHWVLNCHTVTKVTQTAIGDCANKDDTSLIATNDTEAPK